MLKVLCVIACLVASAWGNVLNVPQMKWSKKILELLCQEGNHPDFILAELVACYDPKWAHVFISCQRSEFGATMDSEANMDHICSILDEKLADYASCLLRGLKNSDPMYPLNKCQGDITSVPNP